MVVLKGVEKIYSLQARRRFGRYVEFGCSMNGATIFGDEPVKLILGNGKEVILSGIFQKRTAPKGSYFVRERYYFPKQKNNAAQLATKDSIRQAVLSWQGLTIESKALYNEREKGKKLTGYNLFVKEYILSH